MSIISHRGASAYAPENTLKAFARAVEMGSRYLEFDVHRTNDSILMDDSYKLADCCLAVTFRTIIKPALTRGVNVEEFGQTTNFSLPETFWRRQHGTVFQTAVC
jgi:glycerophosphoryl diester phosphodiesterase